jgi:DNA-binding CsgD family transcriptional regulator
MRFLARAVSDLEERAKHLALATDQPDEEIASTVERGARRARARGALDEAGALEEQAWRLTPEHLEDEKCSRAVESARHHFFAGDRAQAQRVLEEAISAAPPGSARAHALHLLGRVRDGESLDEGRQLQERARAEAGDDFRLLLSIEKNLFHNGIGALDIVSADSHANAELALARRLSDQGMLAVALSDVARAAFLRGNVDAWRLIKTAMDLEPSAGDIWVAAQPSVVLALMQLYADDLESARVLYRSVLERARDRGEVSAAANVLVPLSTVECLAGDYETAAACLHEANDIAEQSSREGLRISCLSRQALVDAHTGNVDAARAHLDEAVGVCARVGLEPPEEVARTRGFIALSLGEAADAVAELAPLVAHYADGGVEEPGCFRFLPDLAEALVATGELERARPLVAEHEARARKVDRGWGLATASRCRALVEAARGDLEAGLGAVDGAVREHERVPMPFERARTLMVKGVIERRAKRRRAARASLQQARALFDELGTPLWAERATVELARIGGRRAGGYELTATEEQVAALVAEGRTNREVAEALFMSVKTVEANLTRIYRKLDVRSRTELASRLTGSGSPASKP